MKTLKKKNVVPRKSRGDGDGAEETETSARDREQSAMETSAVGEGGGRGACDLGVSVGGEALSVREGGES